MTMSQPITKSRCVYENAVKRVNGWNKRKWNANWIKSKGNVSLCALFTSHDQEEKSNNNIVSNSGGP